MYQIYRKGTFMAPKFLQIRELQLLLLLNTLWPSDAI